MATEYNCLNFGYCDKADRHELISLPDGSPGICPECQKQLNRAPGGSGGNRKPWMVGGIVAALALLAGLAWTFWPQSPECPALQVWDVASKRCLDRIAECPPQTLYNPTTKTCQPPVGLSELDCREPEVWDSKTRTCKEPSASPKVLLRFSGSNTLGAELIPELAKVYLETTYAARKPNVSIIDGPKNDRGEVLTREVRAVFADKSSVSISVKAHGSATAFKEDPNNGVTKVGLEKGYVDIGMSSRKVKEEEVRLLEGAGLGKVDASGPRQGDGGQHVVAMDGVAVIVSPLNLMEAEISLEDLRKIYSGQITRWEDIPGVNGMTGPIQPVRRDNLSGTYEFFCDKVMGAKGKKGPADPTPEPLSAATKAFEDSNALVRHVTEERQAIGFVGLAYVGASKPLAIKKARADSSATAVMPDSESVRSGTYPLARPLYLYAKNPAPETVRDFILFALTDAGQRTVAQDGHSVHIIGSQFELPAPETIVEAGKPPRSEHVVLRLHGSHTIGGRLAGELAQQFMKERHVLQPRVEYGAETDTREGRARDVYIIGDIDKDGQDEAIEIKPHGSSTGFRALREGLCEIGLASDKIRPVEYNEVDPRSQKSLKDILGDLSVSERSNVGAVNLIGYDGIAVITNVGNPLEQIDIGTLRDIFTGTLTRWEQVPNSLGRGKIAVYARNSQSGTYRFFEQKVFPNGRLAPGVHNQYEDGQKLAAAVANDPGAIGFVAWPDAKGVKVLKVHEENAQPVAPNGQSIRSRAYPLTRELYMYLARAIAQPGSVTPESLRLAEEFVGMVLSNSGQEIVQDDGFVPVAIRMGTEGATGSLVIPFYIYFDTAKDQPTPESKRDVTLWLANAFRQNPEYRSWSFRLIGFTDDVGDDRYNLDLSQRRALQTKRYLESKLYKVKSYEGRGETEFIGDNRTENGRIQNRRVQMILEPP